MVKGVARRVIVVKSPDPRLFEQAIFLLRENAFQEDGPSSEQVLKQAQKVADAYLMRSTPRGKKLRTLFAPLFFLLGAGLASAFWLLWGNFF